MHARACARACVCVCVRACARLYARTSTYALAFVNSADRSAHNQTMITGNPPVTHTPLGSDASLDRILTSNRSSMSKVSTGLLPVSKSSPCSHSITTLHWPFIASERASWTLANGGHLAPRGHLTLSPCVPFPPRKAIDTSLCPFLAEFPA